MQNKLSKILKEAKYKPEPGLAFSILNTIASKEKRTTQIRLWSFAFISFASLVGLVPAFQILLSDLAHSGFYEYFSLIFSDGGTILSYWKELALSLAETLPTTSIIFTLSLAFIFFMSLKYVIKQIINNQQTGFASLAI
jgi:hypothetical protein